ncbi:MAG: response regulator [Methylococcales bacterium]|nr:response regulator [Methylococcales bacterium]
MVLSKQASISRILIADDMATNRAMLAFAFRSPDFEIVQAGTGEEVLELVKVQPFDCLLLGYQFKTGHPAISKG